MFSCSFRKPIVFQRVSNFLRSHANTFFWNEARITHVLSLKKSQKWGITKKRKFTKIMSQKKKIKVKQINHVTKKIFTVPAIPKDAHTLH